MSSTSAKLNASPHVLGLADHFSYRDDDLLSFLNKICLGVTEVLGEGMAAITLYQNNQKHILMMTPGQADPDQGFDVDNHHSTYVVATGKPLTIYDSREITQFGKTVQDYSGYLGVPLRNSAGMVLGTLCYYVKNPRCFNQEEKNISETFAERAAIAIDNYRLYKKVAFEKQSLAEKVEVSTKELTLAQQKILQQEKLAAIGEFATTVTHEIRSPLSTIGLTLSYLKTLDFNGKVKKRVDLAHSEVNRLERLLSEIMMCAKPITLIRTRFELNNFLQAALISNQVIADKRKQVFVLSDSQRPLWINVDRDKLIQVIINLANNACEAAPNDSEIRWRVEETKDHVVCKVTNRGKVIPEDILPRLTDSFFTMKPNGTGLGLTVVKNIVEAHNGRLDISSTVESGTTVCVGFPRDGR